MNSNIDEEMNLVDQALHYLMEECHDLAKKGGESRDFLEYAESMLLSSVHAEPDAAERFRRETELSIAASRQAQDPKEAETLKDFALAMQFAECLSRAARAYRAIQLGRHTQAWPDLFQAASYMGRLSVTGEVGIKYEASIRVYSSERARAGAKAKNAKLNPPKDALQKLIRERCGDGTRWKSITAALNELQTHILEIAKKAETKLIPEQFQQTGRTWIRQMPDYQQYFDSFVDRNVAGKPAGALKTRTKKS